MAGRDPNSAAESRRSIESVLDVIVGKLPQLRCYKHGTIVMRLADEGRHFTLNCSAEGVTIARDVPIQNPPVVEVIGKSRDIQSVLGGHADGRKRFFAGAFRIRGDLRYFSDLAMELGILKEPL